MEAKKTQKNINVNWIFFYITIEKVNNFNQFENVLTNFIKKLKILVIQKKKRKCS